MTGPLSERVYFLFGQDSAGRTRIIKRDAQGTHAVLSRGRPPRSQRFGIQEKAEGLAFEVDGQMIIQLGGAVVPGACVGLFVGEGEAPFRDFELDVQRGD